MKSKSRLTLVTENVAQALYAVADGPGADEPHNSSEACLAWKGIADMQREKEGRGDAPSERHQEETHP